MGLRAGLGKLEDRHASNALELTLSVGVEVSCRDIRSAYQCRGGFRKQDLSAYRQRRHPCCVIDFPPDQISGRFWVGQGGARVHADLDLQRSKWSDHGCFSMIS